MDLPSCHKNNADSSVTSTLHKKKRKKQQQPIYLFQTLQERQRRRERERSPLGKEEMQCPKLTT